MEVDSILKRLADYFTNITGTRIHFPHLPLPYPFPC